MNDQNLEEPSRYVSTFGIIAVTLLQFEMTSEIFFLVQVDIKQCHYLVDLETDEETLLEPRYSLNKEEWTVIAYKPFLQSSRYFGKLQLSDIFMSNTVHVKPIVQHM